MKAEEAEKAFAWLGRSFEGEDFEPNPGREQMRRRLIIPMIRAEVRRRERAHQLAEELELVAT